MNTVHRIAVLWENVTGYLQAALDALLVDPAVTLFVVQRVQQANALFQPKLGERITLISRQDRPKEDTSWLAELLDFAPDLALITGNSDPGYREAARRLHRAGTITVWASDRILRSWWRDLYQAYLSRANRRWRNYDFAFVPGVAGNRYAHAIGFSLDRIFQGLYTCDTTLFRPVGVERHKTVDSASWPPIFLFVGQFVERKGIDLLLNAYTRYQTQAQNPWELWCAGSGPLVSKIDSAPGVRRLPYLMPEECAQVMGQVGALILPSLWDHWGVVIHEATCAGLPVIASLGCGAAYDLVETGRNGYRFPVQDVQSLTQAMLRLSGEGRARAMGAESLHLSERFSPGRFASVLRQLIPAKAHH